MFTIKVISTGVGEIVLGTHRERFEMPLHHWDSAAYIRQWDEARRSLARGADRACFITGMNDPRTANFIQWWPAWRIKGDIHVQNQILFFDRLSRPFDEKRPVTSVGERTTHSEEGQKISEWVVPLAEFKL